MTPAGKLPVEPRTLDVASVDTVQELKPIAWPMTAPTCLSTMTCTATVLAGMAAPELFTAPRLVRLPSANSPVHVHPSAARQPLAISDLSTAAKTLLCTRTVDVSTYFSATSRVPATEARSAPFWASRRFSRSVPPSRASAAIASRAIMPPATMTRI